jgi:hypothetical protein
MITSKPDWQGQIKFSVEWGIALQLIETLNPYRDRHETICEVQAQGDFQHFAWNVNPATCDSSRNIEFQSFVGDWDPLGEHQMLITAQDLKIKRALAPRMWKKDLDRGYTWVWEGYREVWYIKSVNLGSSRYRITRGIDSAYLFLDWWAEKDWNMVGFDQKLMAHQPNDDRRYMWRVELWNG